VTVFGVLSTPICCSAIRWMLSGRAPVKPQDTAGVADSRVKLNDAKILELLEKQARGVVGLSVRVEVGR